ncbi:hypothetical protein Tco_1025839, partial [Tanacetum coccineum]
NLDDEIEQDKIRSVDMEKVDKKDRKELWKDLRLFNHIVGKKAWVLMGDVNVSLHLDDHSEGILIKKQMALNWKNDNLFDKVVVMKNKVNSIQTLIDVDPTNKELRSEEIRVLNEYKSVVEDEEKFLICHFEGFLGISPIVPKIEVEDGLTFSKTVSEEDVVSMIEEVCEKEIKKALFDIEEDVVSMIEEGLMVTLLSSTKKTWHIIKKDFCEAIKEFFTIGKMLGKMNATLVDLVLKLNTHLKNFSKDTTVQMVLRDVPSKLIFKQAFDLLLDKETKGEIQSTMPFKIGKLLVKYLRVPLVLEKIGVADYKSLIDKVISDGKEGAFSTNRMWKDVRGMNTKVSRKIDHAVVGLGLGMLDDMERGYRDGWIPVIVDDASYKWGNKYSYMVMPLMDVGLVDVV